MDLQQLTDRLTISDFLTTYAHAVDTKDWELYRTLFTDDAEIDYTSAGGIKGTLDEIVTWMTTTMQMFSATQHLVSNEMVSIDGDTATVRAMFFNPMQFAGDDAPYFDCGGWYNHELVRDGDGWKSRKLWEDFSWTTMGS